MKSPTTLTRWAFGAQETGIASEKLSGFYTRFNRGNVKRTHNIRVAIRRLNKLVIPPGKVFSLNERLGKRTQANGYLGAFLRRLNVPVF